MNVWLVEHRAIHANICLEGTATILEMIPFTIGTSTRRVTIY